MAVHIPVLLNETMELLITSKDGMYADLTTGEGGHSREMLGRLNPSGRLYCFDRDKEIQALAKENLKDFKNVSFVLSNFSELGVFAQAEKISFDGILADLGLSMFHYKESQKGFSFLREDPLDMTLDGGSPNLYDVVNSFTEEEIANIIYQYGEERLSRRIAHGIVMYRRVKKIQTTLELAEIIKKSVPFSKHQRGFHPATKSFQAFRIYLNRELENLERMMESSLIYLKSGGRLAVMTYHSLEDRIVKWFFRKKADEKIIKLLTKKPIIASRNEIESNASSRSAKLRVIEKI